MLLINASLSSTYAPVIAEAKRAGVPLLFVGVGLPEGSVSRRADALQFCTTAFAANLRQPRHARVRQGDRQGAGAPRARRHGDPDLARRDRLRRGAGRRRSGMTPVDKEIIPPPTPDYTPFATKLKEADANWVYLLGAVGDAGAHARGAAQARLERRLHHLGASRGRRRARAPQGRQVLRHRRQRAVPGQPADPSRDRRGRQEGERAAIRRSRWRRAGSPAW